MLDTLDLVEVYTDLSMEWRWRRRAAGNGEIIADSGEGYTQQRDCLISATRSNRKPYLLEVYRPGTDVIDAVVEMTDTRTEFIFEPEKRDE